ncbi:MAG: mechanosensitive ion channel protein MscS [Bdellovibrionales bacterium CG10_big_fil_rev_8_21_14_0_10_45_34]|nr:MAG: mechanosensitive ion channel protein MscS [Bdellovibrionales bacterium CG10_big_fil_rev_8_21_14_0_10_45_34]
MTDLAKIFNENLDWLLLLSYAFVIYVLQLGLRSFFKSRLKEKQRRSFGVTLELGITLIEKTRTWFVIIAAVYLGRGAFALPWLQGKVLHNLFVVSVFIQGSIWAFKVIDQWLRYYAEKGADLDGDGARDVEVRRSASYSIIGFMLKGAAISALFLMALHNFGIDITALVAGLGIGGVAVALALQNILGDLFASLTIALDKPFVVGDFLVIGTQRGHVEKIGIKTTRIRSLDGEQIVVSNSDLLSTRIQNFKRMEQRRVLFKVGTTYGTPVETLKKIKQGVKDIIIKTPKTRLDRGHFFSFGDSALIFEFVYFVLDGEYNVYMDTQEEINFKIAKLFDELGADFAFPTQTLHLVSEDLKIAVSHAANSGASPIGP